MNKTVRILLLALVLMLMLFALAACGHEHSFDEAWSHDGSHHWHAPSCEHEDAEDIPDVRDFGTHTMPEKPVVVAPTCGKAGSETYECSVCGYRKVVSLSATGAHTYGDDVVYTQPDANNLIYSQKKCTVCGKKDGYDHIFEGKWSSDETNHWHAPSCECEGEGAPGNIDVAAHDFADAVTVNPTCTKQGTTTKTCKTCKYTVTLETVDSLGHNYTSVSYLADVIVTAKKTCGRCRASVSEKVEGAEVVIVIDTASAQDALDAAKDGAFIYFKKADYGMLTLGATEGNGVAYEGANSSGKVHYRELKNVTLVAHEGATFAGFTAGSAKGAVALTNVTFLGFTFTGTDTALRFDGLYKIDGLTLDGCTMKPKEELGTKKPYLLATAPGIASFTSNGEWSFVTSRKNITVKGCTVEGIFGLVDLSGTENVTITGNEMRKLAGGAITLGGNTPYTGTVTVTDNNAILGLGDRFLYTTVLNNVKLVLTGNSVSVYSAEAPADIVKVEGTLSETVVNDNSFPTDKTVEIPGLGE
ncbi:MAG: hypothetical protein J6V07_02035 [Clostridia bacterium]|nr:hypothetical protein [Clostridia bacterium]